MKHILIAEDNDDLRAALERALTRLGYQTTCKADGDSAIRALDDHSFDLALVDIRMPGRNGLEVLKGIKAVAPEVPVVLMTAHGSVETAVEALRHEAADYLLKPFATDELEFRIDRILQKTNRMPDLPPHKANGPSLLVGDSPALLKIRELIGKISTSSCSVLIQGESGTGKELIAREIHRLSPRADRPLVAISCAALAEGVLESELFGHEKGSFTGAIAQKIGLLESAEGGTVFLDEIGEISPALQVKLLRFLQEHEFQRVGGTKTQHVDVRVIAATNRDLKKDVAAKAFREDLLYRLNVFEIGLPPLRERLTDIPILVSHFLSTIKSARLRRPHVKPEAMAALQGYSWPGNVRELENIVERACVLAENGTIGLTELPPHITGLPTGREAGGMNDEPFHGRQWLGDLEKEMIQRALEENRWNQARAARQLGMKRSTLQYRMQKYDLAPPH